MDEGHKAAESAIRAFQSEVRETYRQAQLDARKALQGFMGRFKAEDEEMLSRLDSGEITRKEYREWRNKKMIMDRRYKAMVANMARGVTDANQIAADVINGKIPSVAAENANFAAYSISMDVGANVGFALHDAGTVGVMFGNHGMYLPKQSVDVAKDMLWNRKRLSSAINKGILLGEPIPKIAGRVAEVIGSAGAQATRYARTAVTAAQNAGRAASYAEANDMGIEVMKRWLSTLDTRTRHSHREIDGETVANEEPFSNDCMYPGDPEGEPSETYNCRCTMVAVVGEVDYSDARRWSRLPPGLSYEGWKAKKKDS